MSRLLVLGNAAMQMLMRLKAALPTDKIDNLSAIKIVVTQENEESRVFVPGFQFDLNGNLIPLVEEVNDILLDRLRSWAVVCLWWHLPNPWLDYRTPVSLLDDPQADLRGTACIEEWQ